VVTSTLGITEGSTTKCIKSQLATKKSIQPGIAGFFLDNGKIELIPILALKEATVIMTLTSMKVTTKYNHQPESTIMRSAHLHTDLVLLDGSTQSTDA
jgi:hypothetical protein